MLTRDSVMHELTTKLWERRTARVRSRRQEGYLALTRAILWDVPERSTLAPVTAAVVSPVLRRPTAVA
jgi:hypothetical protein